MSKIVSELLDEVEQLENATQELETTAEKVNVQKEELETATKQASSEAHLIALETAKVAQSAAKSSQKAASASIKQAEALKAELLEINDSNFNWRKNLRTSVDDFKATKSTITKMVIFLTIISLCSVAAAGYLLYATKKQQAQYKGEVLDMLTTESSLLKKSVTLKIDELAYVIESMKNTAQPIQNETAANIIRQQPEEQNMGKEHHIDEHSNHATNTEKTPATEVHAADNHEAQGHTEEKHEVDSHKIDTDETPNHDMKSPDSEKESLMAAVDWLKTNSVTQKEWQTLQTAIEELKAHANSNPISANNSGGLTKSQVKKLDGMSWLVRKQSKAIEDLQTKIGGMNGTHNSTELVSVKSELQDIKQQQQAIRVELKNIQKTIDLLSELSKQPPPYSYKAK